jgi:hypothetical protein
VNRSVSRTKSKASELPNVVLTVAQPESVLSW